MIEENVQLVFSDEGLFSEGGLVAKGMPDTVKAGFKTAEDAIKIDEQ